MSGLQVQVDDNGTVERLNKILAGVPGGAQQAIAAAAKRAGEQARTKAGRFVAQKYTLSVGSFMAKTKQRLTVSDGFTLDFSGTVIGLNRYVAKDRRPNGVFVQVKRGGGGTLRHAFFGPNGHVFERYGTPRLPIEKKMGPSGGGIMKNDEIVELMEKTTMETFEKRIEVEINRILAGL